VPHTAFDLIAGYFEESGILLRSWLVEGEAIDKKVSVYVMDRNVVFAHRNLRRKTFYIEIRLSSIIS
jgi:hypothetical protein